MRIGEGTFCSLHVGIRLLRVVFFCIETKPKYPAVVTNWRLPINHRGVI